MEPITTEVTRTISDTETAKKLWNIYIEAFVKTAYKSVQEQICYDEEAFLSALGDADYVKFVVYLNGEPGGFVLLTNDLEKARIAYASPDFFRHRWPDEMRERRIYYTTAFAVKPAWQKSHGIFHYVTPMVTEFIDGVDGIFVADHSENSIPWLKMALIHDVRKAQVDKGLRTDLAEVVELDRQAYFAIVLKKSE